MSVPYTSILLLQVQILMNEDWWTIPQTNVFKIPLWNMKNGKQKKSPRKQSR
jgi:hypothetical protein